MPGIAGIISRGPNESIDAAMRAMLRCMAYENFYSVRAQIQPRDGVGIGWVGHRGSFCDCLPIWNEKRDVCLFLEGEIFDDATEAASLRSHGHSFASNNGSYLVHLYEERGLDFLPSLNGWFSGLLLDYRARQIFLFNDRYGLGRIYYYAVPELFVFASEAKALLRVLPASRHLEPESVGEWLACGCTLQNRTLYRGIYLLPAGSVWTITPERKIQRGTYFSRENWENQVAMNREEYCESLAATFERVLPRYLAGDRPIGMSLTGGLDGRMIMAWAHSSPKQLPCYTFGGMIRESIDVQLARRVAELCGETHQVIPVDRKFLGLFPELAQKTIYVSDGEMDVSGAVELYVNRLAREVAPVRLTGNFGSEIVRGNIAFRPRAFNQKPYSRDLQKHITEAVNTYSAERDCHRLSFVAFKQMPWHHHARLSIERSQVTLRSPFLDNDLVSLAFRTPSGIPADLKPSWAMITKGDPKLARIPTDRGLVHPPMPIITQLRCASENYRAKLEYIFDYGMPQWLAGLIAVAKLRRCERLFLGRQKFYHFRMWYRDELAPFVKDVLLDSRTRCRAYFSREFLHEIVSEHTRGNRNYSKEIHQVLSLELIYRELIERRWSNENWNGKPLI
jgi:asparagine synthase (glutamine-hydrolysing)